MPAPSSPSLGLTAVRRLDWRLLAGGAVIAVAVVAAYSRTYSVPLLFDDGGAIANNASIRHWGSAFWPPITTTAGGRPVLNLSLALNFAISGTSVWSYHALNLAIHGLAALTLFGIFRRTLAPRVGPAAPGLAFSAALLWALHPLQTESVTYIVQRAESLMGLFYLLTLYCFIRGTEGQKAEEPNPGRPGTSVFLYFSAFFCLLGMATKEVMVSAPLILLLYDRTFVAGTFSEAWRRRRRFYAGLAATWLILLFLVLSTHNRGGSAGFGRGVSWTGYALTQFPAIFRYLRLSVWPHPLVFNYGAERVESLRAIWPTAVLVTGLMAATGWALVRAGPRERVLGFAGAWFFAILAPTSLVPIYTQTAAEHRMYLALIPVVGLIVVELHRRLGRAALPVCVALAAGLFVLTWERNQTYRSALVLWADTAAHCPGNVVARDNLGCELEKVPGRTRETIAEFEAALRLDPNDVTAHTNLGFVLSRDGRTAEAIAQSEEALRLDPNNAAAHANLGFALSAEGRTAEAIAEYEAAVRLKPNQAEMHYNLGFALARTAGRLDQAIAEFAEALRLKPDDVEAHYDLGFALSAEGRTAEAIAQYEEALRLKPDHAQAHNNLGNALSAEGRTAEAIAQYEAALRLEPNDAEAHNNLGNALSAAGRTTEAITQYETTLRLKPAYAEAHFNLGNALENMPGRLNEAIAQYEAAANLKPDDPAVHLNLADALLRTPGRTEEAVEHLEAVLRLEPGNVPARRILAWIRAARP